MFNVTVRPGHYTAEDAAREIAAMDAERLAIGLDLTPGNKKAREEHARCVAALAEVRGDAALPQEDSMDRKTELVILLKRFGTCGCKDRCQLEQYGEDGNDEKPRGRLSVCELEAGQHGIQAQGEEQS